MPKKKTKARSPKRAEPVVISMGCPSGVGPEIALRSLARRGTGSVLLVGDVPTLAAASKRLQQSGAGRVPAVGKLPVISADEASAPAISAALAGNRVALVQVGPELAATERRPGKPSAAGGAAQLAFVEEGYRLARDHKLPLVTGPVSKEVIAHCGLSRARKFLGHTEWLEALDAAPYSIMCFASPKLVTGLVTTHLPLARVSRHLTEVGVARALCELTDLALRARDPEAPRQGAPRVAVCSFNPHAGEGGLLGREEERAIAPGIELARKVVGRKARLIGPLGAETAFRQGAAGGFDAVLAMYHDQATIPMKLLDFGGGVNVTQGLSIVRTSVDHGTAYDIAGKGIASPRGLEAAMALGGTLGRAARRIPRDAC